MKIPGGSPKCMARRQRSYFRTCFGVAIPWGYTIQPSGHQHFTALCNIQQSGSQPLTPLWYLINLFSLAVGLTGGAQAPTVAAPRLLVTRSSMEWVRRSTRCRTSLQGKAVSMEKSQHELPAPGCVTQETLYKHQSNLYQNALTWIA